MANLKIKLMTDVGFIIFIGNIWLDSKKIKNLEKLLVLPFFVKQNSNFFLETLPN